jgi:hypothetical protein
MRAGPVSKKCSRGKIHHRDTEDTEKIGVPAKAGIHFSGALAADGWVPAFPTDQVRGLKAHGDADGYYPL